MKHAKRWIAEGTVAVSQEWPDSHDLCGCPVFNANVGTIS